MSRWSACLIGFAFIVSFVPRTSAAQIGSSSTARSSSGPSLVCTGPSPHAGPPAPAEDDSIEASGDDVVPSSDDDVVVVDADPVVAETTEAPSVTTPVEKPTEPGNVIGEDDAITEGRIDLDERTATQPTGKSEAGRLDPPSKPEPTTPESEPKSEQRPHAGARGEQHCPQLTHEDRVLREEEELSVDLYAERDEGASRGVSRGVVGRYRRKAEERRVRTVLDDYREKRTRSKILDQASQWGVGISEASDGSYRLYKTGTSLRNGIRPDMFDYWRFVLRGANCARDQKAANSAYNALRESFGRDPKFDDFFEHKRKLLEELY